jgi:hypothetical protein
MTDHSPPPSPKRKPGAQPANRNALKHGFYSRYLHRKELSDIKRRLSGNLAEEQTLLRVLIQRTLSTATENKDFALNLSLLNAVQKAIHTLARLDLIQYRVNPAPDAVHLLLEQARQALLSENQQGRWIWYPGSSSSQSLPIHDPDGNPYSPPADPPPDPIFLPGRAPMDLLFPTHPASEPHDQAAPTSHPSEPIDHPSSPGPLSDPSPSPPLQDNPTDV